jgi:hypothetical protein
MKNGEEGLQPLILFLTNKPRIKPLPPADFLKDPVQWQALARTET